jgi:ABC-type multidrug transport system ATPase subunit
MTAVALLFATYMVKPSPFCFLDEIDAALDENNVLRFVQVLREFGSSSQFIVITHNKKTVIGAQTLLGVTMEESGVTKAIALKLERTKRDGIAEERIPEPEAYLDEDVEPETGTELPSEAERDYMRRQKRKERALAKQISGGEGPEVDVPEVDIAFASDEEDDATTTETEAEADGGAADEADTEAEAESSPDTEGDNEAADALEAEPTAEANGPAQGENSPEASVINAEPDILDGGEEGELSESADSADADETAASAEMVEAAGSASDEAEEEKRE